MVTPRNVYNPADILGLIHKPADFVPIFKKNKEYTISVSVRRDPDVARLGLNDPFFVASSHERYPLALLHYRSFLFSFIAYKKELQMSYEEFIDTLDAISADFPPEQPIIIHLSINEEGEATAKVEETEPIENMFMGLLEQISMVENAKLGTQYDHKYDRPLIVAHDSIDTIPCRETSFRFNENSQLAKAQDRVTKKWETAAEYHRRRKHGEDVSLPEAPEYIPVTADLQPVFRKPKSSSRGLETRSSSPEPIIETHTQLLTSTGSTEDLTMYDTTAEDTLQGDSVTEKEDPKNSVTDDEDDLDILPIPLVYSPTQFVMSAGDYIPALYREGKWHVPHCSAGGQSDALCMFLLQTGTVKATLLRVQGFTKGEDILLISATEGIKRGRIVGSAPQLLYKYTRKRKRNASATDKVRLSGEAAASAKRSSKAMQNSAFSGSAHFGKFKVVQPKKF